MSQTLCGYIRGYSTQNPLLELIESWKEARDKNGYSADILMDLLKAFGTINHDLLMSEIARLWDKRNFFETLKELSEQ